MADWKDAKWIFPSLFEWNARKAGFVSWVVSGQEAGGGRPIRFISY